MRVVSKPIEFQIGEKAELQSHEEYLRSQTQRFRNEAEGLRAAGRLREAQQHEDKARQFAQQLNDLLVHENKFRAEYLNRQIRGLLEEAEALRSAGRLEEAIQHADKAIFRIRQLQELLETGCG